MAPSPRRAPDQKALCARSGYTRRAWSCARRRLNKDQLASNYPAFLARQTLYRFWDPYIGGNTTKNLQTYRVCPSPSSLPHYIEDISFLQMIRPSQAATSLPRLADS